MNPFELKKKSWHFWLARNWGGFDHEWNGDLCTYIKCVIKGLLLFIFAFGVLAVCSVLYLAGMIDIFIGLYQLAIGNEYSFATFDAWAMALNGLVLFGLISFVAHKAKEKIAASSKKKEPSFLQLAYRRFKDKTCVKVEFK